MRVVVITPPEPIVTFEDAAYQLRLASDQSQQTLIEGMIAAATAHIDGPDGWLGRSLGAQTLEARFDSGDYIRTATLPYGPVLDLVAVEYLNSAGEAQEADVALFELLGADLASIAPSFPWAQSPWRREGVRVQYRAGSPENVLAVAKAAILLMVGDLYRNRGEALINQTTATVAMSTTVQNLLSPLRIFN